MKDNHGSQIGTKSGIGGDFFFFFYLIPGEIIIALILVHSHLPEIMSEETSNTKCKIKSFLCLEPPVRLPANQSLLRCSYRFLLYSLVLPPQGPWVIYTWLLWTYQRNRVAEHAQVQNLLENWRRLRHLTHFLLRVTPCQLNSIASFNAWNNNCFFLEFPAVLRGKYTFTKFSFNSWYILIFQLVNRYWCHFPLTEVICLRNNRKKHDKQAFLKWFLRVGRKPQWLKVLTVLEDGQGSNPSTHITANNHLYFQFQRVQRPFCPPQALHDMCACVHVHSRHIHIKTK